MFSLGRILRSFGLVLVIVGNVVGQQFTYENTPILSVINDIEEKTEFRFLYREALIADVRVSFNADKNSLFDLFSSAIGINQLGLKVDEDRFQALIYKSNSTESPSEVRISGYIVDDKTGERLPFATLSWREYGFIDGISTNTNGQFDITINSNEAELLLIASYVGYSNEQILFDLSETKNWNDVAIRLKSKPYSGKEIIVQGINFYTPNDTVLNGLMKIGTFSPLGESNAVRSLQMLPSVSMNAAVNDGINIRGSSSDGFQVLLDGQTVYNQSHLFGLLDAMNADVLKSSGFYYDVTPAQYQAPLGGTLSLITRTGSLNNLQGSVGLSNTALKSTFEGPILKGKSSWLISGRWSYLDDLNWFNNDQIIEYGLDVNRPADLFADPRLRGIIIRDVSLNEINIQNTDATFYDFHSKIYFETKSGTQFILSGYVGNDEATQDYLRDETDFISTNSTQNKWQNASISGQIHAMLGQNIYTNLNVGFTSYSSNYLKDDFEFSSTRDQNVPRNDTVFIQPLNLENEIRQFDLKQTFNIPIEEGNLEFGYSYSDYDVSYVELGLAQSSFSSRRTSQLFDVFQQFDFSPTAESNISIGNRMHYFSNGAYLRWSPRLKFAYFFSEDLSVGAGFSRNYQFMNRLEFYNINSNDFWILTNEDQPPSSVNYYTSGLYWNLHSSLYFQVEGYYKAYENLRLHELNSGAISVSFRNDNIPWFYQNEGQSRGIEFLMKNRFSDVTISTGYTLSKSELKNDLLNEGEFFYANWDRRHQLSNTVEIDLNDGFSLLTSWIFGTGIPSRAESGEEINLVRLPNYSRFDVTFNYRGNFNDIAIDASLSLYNAFDRANAWYSDRKQVTVTTRNNVMQGSALTHVYDLGFQPSFNFKVSF